MKRQTSANCWFTIFCPTVIFKIQADRACWQWQAGVHQGDEGAIHGSGVRRPDDLCRRVSCGLAAGAATRPLRPNLQLSAFHCSVDVPLHQPLGVGVGGSRVWTPAPSPPSPSDSTLASLGLRCPRRQTSLQAAGALTWSAPAWLRLSSQAARPALQSILHAACRGLFYSADCRSLISTLRNLPRPPPG